MLQSLRASAAVATLALLQLAACGGSSSPDAPPSPTQRTTTYGPIEGNDDSAVNGTYSWKGVPFAQAPVGALRWKAPTDPEAWATVRATRQFGNACAQTAGLYSPGASNGYDASIGTRLTQTVGSEDCLYLNIWAPATASATPRPVIVWVHGGSNIRGYTGDPVYDGAALAKSADAVVVSVNYRLGLLGFLNVAQLKTGNALDDSGNFAILDLIKALKFVQQNIAQFGGNAGSVTLMGESAGAVNVYAVQTSPIVVAHQPALFHRLVALSGGISKTTTLPAGSWPIIANTSDYAGQGAYLLQQQLIADGTAANAAAANAWVAGHTAAEIADYLRSRSADALLTTMRLALAPIGASGANPIPEGTVVAPEPIAAIRAGSYLKVPVLAGNCRDEGKLFPSVLASALGGPSGRLLSDAQVFSLAYNYNPNAAPTTTLQDWVPATYLPVDTPTTGFNARTGLITSLLYTANRDDVLNSLKTQQPDVWHYRFDWDELPAPFNDIYGAAHSFDLPFIFGNFGPSLYANISFSTANQPGRLALSDAMMKSLGAFARNGDPNHSALGTTWAPWPARLMFDASNTDKLITVQ